MTNTRSWTRSCFFMCLVSASFGCGRVTNDEPLGKVRQALDIVEGSTNDPGCGWTLHNNHEVWGCTTDLPVGPHGGSEQIDPNDWGLCGITKISADTDDNSVLRIIVGEDGYYKAIAFVGDPNTAHIDYRINCARISDFVGLPDPSVANATQEFSVNSNDAPHPGGGVIRILPDHGGGKKDVCLWSGFEGNLIDVPLSDENDLYCGTHYSGINDGWALDAVTLGDFSHNFTSYTRCDGYDPVEYTGWAGLSGDSWWSLDVHHYNYRTAGPSTTEWLPLLGADNFCWISGVRRLDTETLYAETFIASPPPPLNPTDTWAYETDSTGPIGIQCISYVQN